MTQTARLGSWLGLAAVAIAAGVSVADGRIVLLLIPVGVAAAAAVAVAAVRNPSFGLVVLAVLIAAFPVARVVVRGAPLYGTDVLAVLLLLGLARRGLRPSRFGWLVAGYVASWLGSWLYQIATLHLVAAPTYGLLRNALAVSVFFPAYAVARHLDPKARWLTWLAVGATITAALALLQDAAPATGEPLLNALAPDFTSTALKVYPHRAFALFSAPTTLCGFFAVVIPLLLAGVEGTADRRRKLLLLAVALSVAGALATYSRQWVPALAVGLVVLALLRPRSLGRIGIAAALALTLAWGLFATGTINSGFVSQRFNSLGPTDANVQARLSGEKQFLHLLRSEPTAFAIGKGFAGQDLVRRNLVGVETQASLRAGVNDNVFLLEVFNHGVVAGLLFLGIFLAAFRRVVRAARRSETDAPLLAGIAAALAVVFVLCFLDNYFSEAVFMKAFLWLLVGIGLGTADRSEETVA